MARILRRLGRRFQYVHPTKRHIILITLCFWLSGIALWSIRHFDGDTNGDYMEDTDLFWRSKNLNNYDSVVHQRIRKLHESDTVRPKLYPGDNPKWQYYPVTELFAWADIPAHSVRALVNNNKTYHGEMGEAVKVPADLEAEAKARQSIHQLNVVASELVSLNRRLPDVRHERCRTVQYPKRLPKTSVIVVFHNEAWSTLLRTVHSVINRSPPSLMLEILLIDDASDHRELSSSLDNYLATLVVPTRTIRMEERGGLIRARLAGAEQAEGSVLVFLDAHTEAAQGWLPPILAEIATDRTRVIVPVIDDIMHDTFAYDPVEDDHNRGGLDWKLLHSWIDPEPFIKGQKPTDAFPTPTMIGCAFAIDREYFFASGAYDDKMMIWGGENVEMSVRVWRCGGSLLAAPCSHVGHVYRENTPHTVPGGLRAKLDTLTINTARFAKVWLDDYSNFYYYLNPTAKNMDIGDLSQRTKIIQDQQCHSFQWFLDNVYKDSPFPSHSVYVGQIQHKTSETCLDAVGSKGQQIGLKMCHGLGGFQTFILTKTGELRSATQCIFLSQKGKLLTQGCDFSVGQKWTFRAITDHVFGQFIHQETGKCLSFTQKSAKANGKSMLKFLSNVVTDIGKELPTPVLNECLDGDDTQLWSMNLAAQWNNISL